MKRWLLILGLTLVPSHAGAQDALQDWSALKPTGWSTVHVLDDKGVETSGTFLRITADSLVLRVRDSDVRIEAARIKRIQKRGDSLRNGAIIGAIVGMGIGLISSGIADCPGDDPSGDCPGFRIGAYAGAIGSYTAIGVGIDALVKGRTTVYEAPNGRPGTGATARRHGTVLNVRFRW